jgi:large subunit ribosomal protein L15
VGFNSRREKPQAINVDKIVKIQELETITMETLGQIVKIRARKVKLIGKAARQLRDKIADKNITTSGK